MSRTLADDTHVPHFVETTAELLSVYKAEVPNHSSPILDKMEGIWEEELRLKLSDFASRQNLEQTPPAGSQWYPNWHVPEGRTMGGVG